MWLEREFLSQLVQWLCSNLCRALRKMGMKHIHVAWVHTEPFTRVAVGRFSTLGWFSCSCIRACASKVIQENHSLAQGTCGNWARHGWNDRQHSTPFGAALFVGKKS